MTEKLILAVDLGTSGMKVALITESGKVLGGEAEPVSDQSLCHHIRFDPDLMGDRQPGP